MDNNLPRQTGRACGSLFMPILLLIHSRPALQKRIHYSEPCPRLLVNDDRIDRLDFALSNPPLETPRPTQAESQVLTILGKIDHRQERVDGPHMVSCYLDSDESRHYVAKIYDGFDYPLVHGTLVFCTGWRTVTRRPPQWKFRNPETEPTPHSIQHTE